MLLFFYFMEENLMGDISLTVVSGTIIGNIEIVPAKVPAVTFTLQSVIAIGGKTITSEFEILAIESAAAQLRPKDIESGSNVLIEGGMLYVKDGKTFVRIDSERQIRKMERVASMDEGTVQANEKLV
jgi:hypothetical protein